MCVNLSSKKTQSAPRFLHQRVDIGSCVLFNGNIVEAEQTLTTTKPFVSRRTVELTAA